MIKKFLQTIILFLLIIQPVFANQGGNDTFGYMWTDNQGSGPDTVGVNWINAKNGTPLFTGATTFPDDSVKSVALPFNFTFYGVVFDTIYVSTNGFIAFTVPSHADPSPETLPSASAQDSMIAVYWDDHGNNTINDGAGIWTRTIGTSPNRRFIVEWQINEGSGSVLNYNFQVILDETTNLITLQYNNFENELTSEEVGIQADDTDGFSYGPGAIEYNAVLIHNRLFNNGADAEISPTTTTAGDYEDFTYTFDNIDNTPAGLAKADHFAIVNPFGNTNNPPVITQIDINGTQAFIQKSSSKPQQAGFATWDRVSGTDDSLIIRTANLQVISSLDVYFTQVMPDTVTSTQNYNSRIDAFLDNSLTQAANSAGSGWGVDVQEGALAYVRIEDAANGAGSEYTTGSLTAGDNLTLYAAGYDANGNYIADTTVNWSTTGSLDEQTSTGTSSFTFNSSTAPASGTIVADYADAGVNDDATGEITVSVGALNYLKIRTAANNGGEEFGDSTMTTDDAVTFYAAGYDDEDNYIRDVGADWSLGGSLSGSGGTGTSFTYAPDVSGRSGAIAADTTGVTGDITGTITVIDGALAYVRIVDAAGGAGSEYTTGSLTAGDNLTLYAAGYDADDNFVADQSVDWSTTGSLDDTTATGASFTFNSHTAPASGTIEAGNAFLGVDDATGEITVSVGALNSITIRTSS